MTLKYPSCAAVEWKVLKQGADCPSSLDKSYPVECLSYASPVQDLKHLFNMLLFIKYFYNVQSYLLPNKTVGKLISSEKPSLPQFSMERKWHVQLHCGSVVGLFHVGGRSGNCIILWEV